MDMLTFVDESGRVLFAPKGCNEDVGYTIIQLAEGGHIDLLEEIADRLATCEQRLNYYEELEEQGKLIKLPCAVGDTVYTNHSMQGWYFRKEDRPYAAKIVFIRVTGTGYDNCMNVDFGNGHMLQFNFSDIGKTVFLTESEAEAKLKG